MGTAEGDPGGGGGRSDSPSTADARRAAERFGVGVSGVRPFGRGHINDTYLALTAIGELVVQRLNRDVFPDPEAVTDNIVAVHRHLRGAWMLGSSTTHPRGMPDPVPTLDGSWLHTDGSGVWRAWRRVPDAAPAGRSTPAVAAAAGRLLGHFHHWLATLDPAGLTETLPGFHDPGRRLEALRAAVAADPCGRAAGVGAEIARAEAGAPLVALAADLAARVPRRVAHNDAKLDNVLFRAGEAVCLVDFDTVMPGPWLWDLGDLLRSGATTAAEDDPSASVVDPALYWAVVDGYRSALGDVATDTELEAAAYAGAIVTYEQAVRFLTDWIAGDVYYRISRPEQNLDRARAQFKLVASMPLSRIG